MDDSLAVPEWLSVSRETLKRLEKLCQLVVKWNPTVNLISKSTTTDIWQRHLLDSAQLYTVWPAGAQQWLDIGSGAGFPGLVVSILAAEHKPDLVVTLVESDRRKAVFLKEAARFLELPAVVVCQRIENIEPFNADVISARALTSLNGLCQYAQKHLNPKGQAIFLKGASAVAEIEEASKSWRFSIEVEASKTDPSASLILLKDIKGA